MAYAIRIYLLVMKLPSNSNYNQLIRNEENLNIRKISNIEYQ